MNVIISFVGLEDRQKVLKSGRPFALQPLASATILGHILERLKDVPVQSFVIVVSAGAEEVDEWVQQLLPKGSYQVLLVEKSKTPLTALLHCKQYLDSNSLLFVSGDFITEVDFSSLEYYKSDAVFLIQAGWDRITADTWFVNAKGFYAGQMGDDEVSWAGVCWFRHGEDLIQAVSSPSFAAETGIKSLLSVLKGQGFYIGTLPVKSCFGTNSPDQLLHANARLMSLGYCSEDAIERSYSDEFTVLPPVFLHETAVIENAVIGPFVNLEANAVIRNSVVSNSLIGVGALIQDAVLEGSFIGDQAHVNGRKNILVVGDESQLKLD